MLLPGAKYIQKGFPEVYVFETRHEVSGYQGLLSLYKS